MTSDLKKRGQCSIQQKVKIQQCIITVSVCVLSEGRSQTSQRKNGGGRRSSDSERLARHLCAPLRVRQGAPQGLLLRRSLRLLAAGPEIHRVKQVAYIFYSVKMYLIHYIQHQNVSDSAGTNPPALVPTPYHPAQSTGPAQAKGTVGVPQGYLKAT